MRCKFAVDERWHHGLSMQFVVSGDVLLHSWRCPWRLRAAIRSIVMRKIGGNGNSFGNAEVGVDWASDESEVQSGGVEGVGDARDVAKGSPRLSH